MATTRRSKRLSQRAEAIGFEVTDLSRERKDETSSSISSEQLVPRYTDPIEPSLQFLYRPHSIAVLTLLVLGLLYSAFSHTSPTDASGNLAKGIAAVAVSFIFIGVLQFSDGPIVRPHPLVWRLVLSISILYLLLLILVLFQSVDVARQWLGSLDPSLGIPLEEKSYAEDCSLSWANLADKMDMFVLAHLFGWMGKALILRDAWLAWILSIMFEVMEYSLEFQLPNFGECWWDHWILDVAICNWAGIEIGMAVCRYFQMKTYNWRSVDDKKKEKKSFVQAVVGQLSPHSWTSFDWAYTKTLKGYLVSLTIVIFFLASELNCFYLKALLWVPPPHWLNAARVVLHGLMGMVALRELYQYFTDPQCKKLGAQLWVTFAVIIVETLICIKFGRGSLSRDVPRNVVYFWIGFTSLLILFPVYRFWYRPRHRWENVTMALWLKYPNPFSKHVLAGDVTSRTVDHLGRLCTTRVILKTSAIPAWISHWIRSTEAYVVEESMVDPVAGTMVTRTKNLNHQKKFVVEETQTYTKSPDDNCWTLIETQAKFTCNFKWFGLASKLESLGAMRFKEHLQKSRDALQYVIERLRPVH